eukprot:m.4693 g.4693  ORF g.4693 m.4693 type:complete len:561 (-) comp2445_c0_seq1:43-1725(-)
MGTSSARIGAILAGVALCLLLVSGFVFNWGTPPGIAQHSHASSRAPVSRSFAGSKWATPQAEATTDHVPTLMPDPELKGGKPEDAQLRPPFRHCPRPPLKKHQDSNPNPKAAVFVACFLQGSQHLVLDSPASASKSHAECAAACSSSHKSSEQMPVFAWSHESGCHCRVGYLQNGADASPEVTEERCLSTSGAIAVFRLGEWPPPFSPPEALFPPNFDPRSSKYNTTITVFLWANPRLASLFRTCRLTKYTRRFDYVIIDPRHQIRSQAVFKRMLLDTNPGFKFIVHDACCTPGWALLHWPKRSVLLIASDEISRWGLSGRKNSHWGPHGPGELLDTDANGTIILPEVIPPFFKQYYSKQHVAAFGRNIRYMPLGSREEFPDIDRTQLVPAPRRRYLCNLMVAPTHHRRRYLLELLMGETVLDKDKVFLHMAQHWDANLDNPVSDYLNASTYQERLLESVFTLCPKGHSIEQYRIYEAIESGSIPVMEREGTYAEERLPPEYFSSPMLFVDDWAQVPQVLSDLARDPLALLQRQVDMLAWYDHFMSAKVDELEDILLARL